MNLLQTKEFKYIGSCVEEQESSKRAMQQRIPTAWSKWREQLGGCAVKDTGFMVEVEKTNSNVML